MKTVAQGTRDASEERRGTRLGGTGNSLCWMFNAAI